MKPYLYLLLSVFIAFQFTAVGQTNVVFYNAGAMHIATGGEDSVALYIEGAMRHVGSDVFVELDGQLNLNGNFYQDASTPVFKVNATPFSPPSTGTLRFVGDFNTSRLITSNNLATTYNRTTSYIAFPHVLLATNDSVYVGAKMGMDALSVKRTSGYSSKLFLESAKIGTDVFDASLRITGSGKSNLLVDSGLVIVEREMSAYRSTSGNEKLFGFASPYKNTQRSGYFAGNWVRRPVANDSTGHTAYIFANEKDGSGVILRNQYIYDPNENLQVAQAYLVRPRNTGFTYQQLINSGGLGITGAANTAYDQSKFSFNGQVYSMDTYKELLFADDTLYSSPQIASSTSTINWLIGNSYTAPISVDLLAEAMGNSTLKFAPYIWYLPAGSTTYQTHPLTGTGNILLEDIGYLPAMSVFMIRVLSGTAAGQFHITRSMLRHAAVSHGNPSFSAPPMQKLKAANEGQLRFRVTPVDNELIYDIAAIGIRQNAKVGIDTYDMTKVYSESDVFQLYSLSSDGTKLSANGVPPTVTQLMLHFKPVSESTDFVIWARDVQSLNTDAAWLEDTKTKTFIDLRLQSNYTFRSDPDDDVARFKVHFVTPAYTDLSQPETNVPLSVSVRQDIIKVSNLQSIDRNAEIVIYDMSGRVQASVSVGSDKFQEVYFPCPNGVYILQLKGVRNERLKFIKNIQR